MGNAYFEEHGQVEGAYNAVKMKDRIEDILGSLILIIHKLLFG